MMNLSNHMGPAPYVPHEAPYGDFIVVINPSRTLHSKLVELDALVRYCSGCVVYSWGLPSDRHCISGHGIVDGVYLIGPRSLSSTPIEITVGPCVALSLGDQVQVVTENFGSQAVYYSDKVVTNRIQLAALAVGGVDELAMFATMHSNHMFCQQFNVFQTPVRGVQVAPPGARIIVDAGIALREDESGFDYSDVISVADYRDLIKKGAAEIIANVDAIIRSGNSLVCDITGGQDSRMVFAAIVAMGKAQDVAFHTRDLSKSYVDAVRGGSATRAYELARKDVDIATSLVAKAGGSFVRDDGGGDYRAFRYTTFDDNVMRRRSHMFGSYHFITTSLLRSQWPYSENPLVRMMGGGGETYRGYYQDLFGFAEDQNYNEEAIRAALRSSKNNSIDFGPVWEDLENLYVDTFNRLPGCTIDQKLDNHYLFFRNRYHFGLNLSFPSNGMSINPALSKSLLSAARLLPHRERMSGRVIFDVTRELSEWVAYHDYDKFDCSAMKDSIYHAKSELTCCRMRTP